ncbi:MAG: winged helix-turn-helix transcriptional regulator [Anaerolineae bacterium]|nr:winged helix-turn-helix transcriptional regulator [Anaerolineae bacterium]
MTSISGRIALSTKARLFRGFGDPSRLSILEVLLDGPRNVSEIVQATELTQPNVSSHLSCLRDCGLVSTQQRGKYMIYQLSDPGVNKILSLASSLLADVAKGVYECTRYAREDELSVDLIKE